jgi:hypothetical protein
VKNYWKLTGENPGCFVNLQTKYWNRFYPHPEPVEATAEILLFIFVGLLEIHNM